MLAALLAVAWSPEGTVLERSFVRDERAAYRVQANLKIESRGRGISTWMPAEVDLKYDFDTWVRRLKADGIAELLYRRPNLIQVEDVGAPAGPYRKVDKLDWNVLVTLSPRNRVLDFKRLPAGAVRTRPAKWIRPAGQDDPVEPYITEITRLAMFVGGLDTSLDLAPPLPLRPVVVGDTWAVTAAYHPQKLPGQSRTAVQRLDTTYTYRGLVGDGPNRVHRVTGQLDLDTDLAEFFNQQFARASEDSGLERLPMRLTAYVEFDLDPGTLRTRAARARSSGGFQIFLTAFPDEAVAEQKFAGTTLMGRLPPTKAR